MSKRWVRAFSEGNAKMKELLGGKGANLAEMTRAGLPVPPGFTVTTDACRAYLESMNLPAGSEEEIRAAVLELEQAKAAKFGDASAPLLVSVRSGSVESMPGMMDTILNLGLNDDTAEGLAKITGNPRFAYDCYRRLIQMFGNVVKNIPSFHFEQQLHLAKRNLGIEHDNELPAEALQALIQSYKTVFIKNAGSPFPQDVYEQLLLAVEAVFRSWNNDRAKVYRRANKIPDHQGTAVNIQSMVFGNWGTDSGTGVVFTRNPSTGEKLLFGEYLVNAQGEDVVAGIRTPEPIARLGEQMPEIYEQVVNTCAQLEKHYRDMQDIEFTVERSKLYVLQTRSGKRTAQAAVTIAVQLANDGVISKEEAVNRLEVAHLDKLLHAAIDEDQTPEKLAKGLPASPGAAVGAIVFDADEAVEWAKMGRKTILVSNETTPEDIHGVIASVGVLTARGGMTSHAAVVARGMGKPCVCGCESLSINEEELSLTVGNRTFKQGDVISIDGATGQVYIGEAKLKQPEVSGDLETLLEWADSFRTMKVYANADTPEDAQKAREWGAEGIGLCRTEHMFMQKDRLPIVQRMIMSDTDEERNAALELLLPFQQSDFEGLFRAMDGYPVTIRLLDPPLHEFLPNHEALLRESFELEFNPNGSAERKAEVQRLLRKVKQLHEANPMMGLRGCRLGLLFPEIYRMQAQAIVQAVQAVRREGVNAIPLIMLPLIGHVNELKPLHKLIDDMAKEVLGAENTVEIGTMIEVPRAALTAEKIADYATFFSFGTNDLTQMTFGYSRDDAEGTFLNRYVEDGLLADNPFQVLDADGVGALVKMAVEKGVKVKPDLKKGICGEHGGDRQSIFFCQEIGLDYVSCSPFRVPIARISAAQASLHFKRLETNQPELHLADSKTR